jgi:YesN/AraC family two-component response regulator
MDSFLNISAPSVIESLNGGLFISPGEWIHSTRKIDSYELILVHEGIVKLFEEKQHFNVKPGEMLLLFPGRTHGGTEKYYGKLSFYWLHFKVRDMSTSGLVHNIKIPQHIISADSHRLSMLFRQYLNTSNQSSSLSLKAELLILEILSEASQSRNTAEASSIIAEQIFRFIAEHYHEPISTVNIAHELHRNPDYLGRCFKETHGCTITEEINRRRLQEAEKLLIDTGLNLNEVAMQCGFNGYGYFRRLFIRKNGITPGRFRSGLSRIHINTL